MSILRTSLGLISASFLVASAAHAQIVEDFENGNPDSWQIDFDGTVNGFQISAVQGTLTGNGNPGTALTFLALQEQIGPWFFNTPTSTDWKGDFRSKGVDGFSIDMNYTGSSPFGAVAVLTIADDMGTPEVMDDVYCWGPVDFAQYSFAGFGAALPPGVWNTISFAIPSESTTLPAGWTCNNINGNFAGDVDATWNAMIQDVDYLAFLNGTPWGGFPLTNLDVSFDNVTLTTGAVGTPYCFCDGSGTVAPCANPGIAGNGCANGTTAAGANLSAVGNASVSASTLVLNGTGTPPLQPGLYFQGDVRTNGGMGLLFGDGLRCAGGNVIRLEVVIPDSNGDSFTTLDLAAKGGAMNGQTLYYQLWYRDPLGSPCGALFNTTNALEVSWGI